MMGEPDPPWPRETVLAIAHEVAGWFAALGAIVSAPARFAEEWSAGRRRALNPLAFQLNALAVLGPWRVLWARLLDPSPPTMPLWWELVKSILPLVGLAVGMTLCHVFVVVLGGRRPLRSTVAMAFYVAAGPLAILSFVGQPIELYALLHPTDPRVALPVSLFNLGLLVTMIVYQLVMVAAVHRIARWRVLLATCSAWLLYGLFWVWMSAHHHAMVQSIFEG